MRWNYVVCRIGQFAVFCNNEPRGGRGGGYYRLSGSFGGKTSVFIKGENRRLFFWKAVNVKVQFSIKQKLCKLLKKNLNAFSQLSVNLSGYLYTQLPTIVAVLHASFQLTSATKLCFTKLLSFKRFSRNIRDIKKIIFVINYANHDHALINFERVSATEILIKKQKTNKLEYDIPN